MDTKVIRFEITVRRPTLVLVLSLTLLAVALAPILSRSVAASGSSQQVTGPPLADAASIVASRIHYQGRLEGAAGPVTMTFRLWSDATSTAGADLLWEETQVVTPTTGLFNARLGASNPFEAGEHFTGQRLWLGVEVEGDGEMVPRQEIIPVPYALSLRPGAQITGAGVNVLKVNQGPPSTLSVVASIHGHSGSSNGVAGSSDSLNGVYGRSESGTGVLARSGTGVAIYARGTGIIRSVADTTVWFPGTAAMVRIDTSGLTIYYHGDGIARLRASSAGQKQIVLPISVPAVLYGQPVEVEELTFAWRCKSDTSPGETIQRVRLYRSDGLGDSRTVLDSATERSCNGTDWQTATFPFSPSTDDSVLSADDGLLTFELTVDMLTGSDHEIWFSGVRLRLGHDAS